MANLQIRVDGSLGQMSADRFIEILQRNLRILHDLDVRISEQRGGTVQWTIAGLSTGSAAVELRSRVVRGRADYGSAIRDRFTSGISLIELEGITPPYFSSQNVESVYEIVRQIGHDGITGVEYTPEFAEGEKVQLTEASEAKLLRLTGIAYYALGAVEGRVELVSVQKRSRRFNVTQDRTLKSVRCNFPENLEDSVFEAIRERRRVVVSGRIAYNARHEPLSLFLSRPLRYLGPSQDLPKPDELAGRDADFTGRQTTEEFVRSLRDG